MKPNLFSLATKELSQDAFLTWLLQWADPPCCGHNAELHAVAVEFVNRLIALQGTAPTQITRVEAGRQWDHIDVWAKVNDSHLIIIEDKTGTGQHSDQLAKYKKTGEVWCRERGCELVCVYIKTHSESSQSLKQIIGQGFAVFSRLDLLELLNAHEVRSDIYNDFRDRLQALETNESGFGGKKIGQWNADDWRGFYRQLEESRDIVGWGWVNPPSGAFLNCVLKATSCDGFPLSMQIEQGPLCFKVGEIYKDRREIRGRFHRLLMDHSDPSMGLARPGRFGSGTYMTIAVIPRSVWLGGDEELLDVNAVLDRLNRYESWLAGVIESAESIPHSTQCPTGPIPVLI